MSPHRCKRHIHNQDEAKSFKIDFLKDENGGDEILGKMLKRNDSSQNLELEMSTERWEPLVRETLDLHDEYFWYEQTES